MRPPIHVVNMDGNDVQQPIDNEDVNTPHDVDPSPYNLDYWVRRSTGPKRQVNRYHPSMHYIMLSDEGEPLTNKEVGVSHHARWDKNVACK